MTNSKNTKRALFTSVVAILLCCTMLLGTTFAWFTDEAKSANNVIQAGNLDIALEYKTNWSDAWAPVTEDTKLFKENALWEPGYTEVVFLRVSNVGSLAFNYALDVVVNSEQTSTNVFGNEFSLKDYVQAGAYAMDENGVYADALMPILFADRAKALENIETVAGTGFINIADLDGLDEYLLEKPEKVVLPGEQYNQVVALVLTMPTTVDNNANYDATVPNVKAPSLNLGISFVAKQAVSESDTFGPDYDADANYANYPIANVGKLENNNVPATWGIDGDEVEGGLDLDVAYKFLAPENEKEVATSPYRWWHADFVVKADKDVKEDSVALAGYYEVWCDALNDGRWVALTAGEDIPAGTEIRLVEGMGGGAITVNYKELCQYSYILNDATGEYEPTKGFQCGAADLTGENAGTTLTVELRLYEVENADSDTGSHNEETGEYITVGTFTHKF